MAFNGNTLIKTLGKTRCNYWLSLKLIIASSLTMLVISSYFLSTSHINDVIIKLEELQTINLTIDINAFSSETSYGYQYVYFIKEPNHKLLYCFIPKNSCTKMKQLFWRLITGEFLPLKNGTEQFELLHAYMEWYKPNTSFVADKLLHDKSWKSVVILRDPLERLVSGFNDKCVRDERHWCEGPKTTNFTLFVSRILDKIKNKGGISDHFRPQYTFCGLDKYFEYFDEIIYYDEGSIAKDTWRFMKNEGIDELYWNWNGHQNEKMFEHKTSHSNKKIRDKRTFYAKYYTKALALEVIDAFQRDYTRLKIQYPKWLKYLD